MKQHFEFLFRQGRLANCWLVETDSPSSTLGTVSLFIENCLLQNNMVVTNHPDYRLVECDHSSASKCITIEQIRGLQDFFSKTPSISEYRIAVIYQADLMNLNAANACLKLLEDTPKDSFLFLITSKPGVIIDTIRSRCAKIRDTSRSSLIAINDRYIDYIANYSNPDSRVALIEEFANKDRESWRDFAYTTIYLISKRMKKSLNINTHCTASEELILEKLKMDSPNSLLQKYSYLKTKINQTTTYDLDLRVSTIELMEELYRN